MFRLPALALAGMIGALMSGAPAATAAPLDAGSVNGGPPAALAQSELDDLLTAQRIAQARAAIAEAQRSTLLAQLPPATAKPLAGTLDTGKLGAAGLLKAFDLAVDLAHELCDGLPANTPVAIYDPGTAQGVVAARLVDDGIAHVTANLQRQNQALQDVLDLYAGTGDSHAPIAPVVLAAVPAVLRALADTTSLFKTDLDATGTDYGDGARALFVTALAQSCPGKFVGLGGGYLGELYPPAHASLVRRVRHLADLRGQAANRSALVQRLADGAKGDEKKQLAAIVSAAGAVIKTADAFVDSLKVGQADSASPLYSAARFLGYGQRTAGALLLDFDLQLQGLTLVKDSLFTGQHLKLAGIALLWYRLHAPDGTLRAARALRRISRPVDVDLRGAAADDEYR